MVSEKRILIVLLVALLIVPVLLVPASAASSDVWYSYDEMLFPEVPYVDPVSYPYQMIVSTAGVSTFVATDVLPFVYYRDSAVGYVVDFSAGTVLRCVYDKRYYSWSNLHSSSTSNNIALSDTFSIWSSFDLYYGSTLYNAASVPQVFLVPDSPSFNTDLVQNRVYSYQLEQVAGQLFVDASGSSGESLVYQWQSYLNGEWTSVSNSSSDPRYFTPPTSVEGTFQYRCFVYYSQYGPDFGNVSNSVYVVVGTGSGSSTDSTVSVGEQVIIDQITGVQDSIDSVNDSLNATNPALDDSIGGLEDSSSSIEDFEGEQWQQFEDNSAVITDQFEVFSDTGSLVGAFSFLSGIVNNSFNALGNYQVVITLPIALGIIMFIWSRTPGNTVPRKHDGIDKNYLKGKQGVGGPVEHRDGPFYDSDRDQSPL